MTQTSGVEANLTAYSVHQRAVGALFWLPTVLLYLIDQVGLARALQLASFYYLSVVVLEVPSGWFSDRVGRVAALRVTAVAWVLTQSLFLIGGLWPIVGAQFCLAVGYSFLSGTDSTFHFDTLDAEGRSAEFERREATVRRGMLLSTAAAAVIGGGLGFIDLRLPFAAALIAAIVQVATTLRMKEPRRASRSAGFGADLRAVLAHLRRPLLAWVTFYVVAEVILIHLVSELTPPYFAMALERPVDDPAGAAVIAGIVAAVAAVVAAGSLRFVEPARQRFGAVMVLLTLGGLTAATSVLMAVVVSLWILPAIATRGVQAAATSVLVPGIVSREVEQHHRATMLSITSLLGRCSYALVLLALAAAAGDVLPDTLDLAAIVALVAAVAAVLAALLLVRD